MQELIQYLKENKISRKEVNEELIEISGETYFLVKPDEDGLLFDDNFHLIVDEDFDKYVFKFGGKWYWEEDPISPKLNELKYIGKAELDFPAIPFLGVHGKYEILNGSRDYNDWCKKANFLGVNTLGICEKNTLAGTLAFQQACIGNGIKPIIGATYTIDRDDYRYDVKCYVKTKNGWNNILKINKEVRIVNNGYIKEKDFMKLTGGIFIVFDPKSIEFDKLFPWDLHKEEIYYQFDCTEFDNNDRDKWVLENLKKFINSKFTPVLISDAYYLDEEESYIKKKLNIISSKMEYSSSKQYFKCFDDILSEVEKLFPDTSKMLKIIEDSVSNLEYISGKCNFTIKLGEKHLPEYKMRKEEKKKYGTKENMFWSLIEEGLEKKKNIDVEKYLDRVEKEVEIIEHGKLKDYFLINHDQVRWSEEQNILVGLSRGSAAGFLTSNLLNITKIDPFEYELIAERFLTKERAVNKIADIDLDNMQGRREEIKDYLIEKYGYEQCCSVGTYTTLQLKGCIKELARLSNVEYGTVNMITKSITVEDKNWVDLFKKVKKDKILRNFINKHPEIINDAQLMMGCIKSESIHASAFIITPEERKVFEWMPLRKEMREGKEVLISEWEGYDLEDVGFLKQDILGLKALDMIQEKFNSIKIMEGVNLKMEKIPLDDKKTFQLFSDGHNKNVFQFEAEGLSGYTKELKPQSIEDVIATVALYRPGAIDNNFHNEYILLKNGEKEPEYMWGCEEITKNTYGLPIYQEQIMFICQKVGGFNLAETDEIRRGLGKKKLEIIQPYKEQFLNHSTKNGCPRQEAIDIWEMLEKFSGYSFNRSHAAAYGITSYITQWIKANYPIHSWTTAFSYAKDTDIPGYISEIHKTGDIKVTPPDINISRDTFTTDFEKNSITWSLTSIKQVAEKSVEEILRKREEEGEIFSFEEFLSRHTFKGSKVNKSVIENLVLSGCFDKVEDIKQPTERIRLIDLYREKAKVKVDKEKDKFHTDKDFLDENWWWTLQQKLLSGFAIFPYNELIEKALEAKGYGLIDIEDFFEEDSEGKKVKIGGYINEIKVRNSKKGEYAKMTIESNYEFINVTIWAEQWDVLKDVLEESEKKIILLSGRIQYDSYDKKNALVLSDESEVLVLE